MLRTFGLALLLSVVCHAQTNTAEAPRLGSFLYHDCQAAVRIMDAPSDTSGGVDDLQNAEFCEGYFNAFGDINELIPSSICIDDATLGTVIRVYVTYMEKNPKLMDDLMIVGVMRALKDAYPCHVLSRSAPQKKR